MNVVRSPFLIIVGFSLLANSAEQAASQRVMRAAQRVATMALHADAPKISQAPVRALCNASQYARVQGGSVVRRTHDDRELARPFGRGSRSQGSNNFSRLKSWARTGAAVLLATAAAGYAAQDSIEYEDLLGCRPARQSMLPNEVAYYLESDHILEMSSDDMDALLDTCYDNHAHKPKEGLQQLLIDIMNALLRDGVLVKINPEVLRMIVGWHVFMPYDVSEAQLVLLMEKICELHMPQKTPETFLVVLDSLRLMRLNPQFPAGYTSAVIRPLANYVTLETLARLSGRVSAATLAQIQYCLPADRRRVAITLLPGISSFCSSLSSSHVDDVVRFMYRICPSGDDTSSDEDQAIARLMFSIAGEPGRLATLSTEFLYCMSEFAPCLHQEDRLALMSRLMHECWEQRAIYHMRPTVVTKILENAPMSVVQDFLSKLQNAQILHALDPSIVPTALERIRSFDDQKIFSDCLRSVLHLVQSDLMLFAQCPHLITKCIAFIKNLPPSDRYHSLKPFVDTVLQGDLLGAADSEVTVAIIEHINQFFPEQERTQAVRALLKVLSCNTAVRPIETEAIMRASGCLDASSIDDLLVFLNGKNTCEEAPSTSEQQLKQFMYWLSPDDKAEFLAEAVGGCRGALPGILKYVRHEEAEGRIVGFHGNHDLFSLLRDVFTRLYSITTITETSDDFRFFRFDRSSRTKSDEQNLARDIASSWTPGYWREHLLFFTLSLFASAGGSSPLSYAASNSDQSCVSRELPTLRSLFDQLGIPKLGEALEREGLLAKLKQQHTAALGHKGSLVTISMTPQFASTYAYPAGSGGLRKYYTYWWSRWMPLLSSNTTTLAQSMKHDGGGRGLLFEEHCLVIPDALTDPDHARKGDIRIREFFPGLDKEAYTRYEKTRDEILSRVAHALLFPEGVAK